MINQENGLIHNRVTWMITFESLLFTALGLAINSNSIHSLVAYSLAGAFSLAGVLVAITSMWGMCGPTCAIFELRLRYHERHPLYAGAPVIGLDPPIWPRRGREAQWLTPILRIGWFITVWNVLPLMLIFSWLVVWNYVGGLSIESVFVGTVNSIVLLILIALSMTSKWPSWCSRVHREAAKKVNELPNQ
jgi:hypothetical protein